MAQSVDSTIVLPAVAEQARTPIVRSLRVDDAGNVLRGNWIRAKALNTLHEQYVGALVNDWSADGLLDESSATLTYWPRNVFGRHYDRPANVEIYLTAEATGASPSGSITVSNSGGSVNWNYSSDLATITKASLGKMTVDTSAERVVITVSAGTFADLDVTLYGVSIRPSRAAGSLDAGVWTSGLVGSDSAEYGVERGLTPEMLRNEHGRALEYYQRRGCGNVFTAARGGTSADIGALVFGGVPPRGCSALRILASGSPALSPSSPLVVQSDLSSVSVEANATAYDLDVTPGIPVRARVAERGGGSRLLGLTAYWADSAAP